MNTSTPNYCIYFISIGEAALECFRMSYQSLRSNNYTGDIFVLTDSNALPFATDEKVRVLQLVDSDMNLDLAADGPLATVDVRRLDMKNSRNQKMFDKFVICHGKALIEKYIDIDQYDYLVYLDSDILLGADIAAFESFLKEHDGKIIISSSRTRWLGEFPLFLSPLWFKPGTRTANLTVWELFKYWHTHPICADIVCIPVTETGKRFLGLWLSECQKGIDSDQAALQAILLRDFADDHILAPYTIFGYGPSEKDYAADSTVTEVPSVFVHFHGAVRDDRAMRTYAEKYVVKPSH